LPASIVVWKNGDFACGLTDGRIMVWCRRVHDGGGVGGGYDEHCTYSVVSHHRGRVKHLCILPNGNLASASTCGNNAIKVWTRQLVRVRTLFQDIDDAMSSTISSLIALPNGDLISGSNRDDYGHDHDTCECDGGMIVRWANARTRAQCKFLCTTPTAIQVITTLLGEVALALTYDSRECRRCYLEESVLISIRRADSFAIIREWGTDDAASSAAASSIGAWMTHDGQVLTTYRSHSTFPRLRLTRCGNSWHVVHVHPWQQDEATATPSSGGASRKRYARMLQTNTDVVAIPFGNGGMACKTTNELSQNAVELWNRHDTHTGTLDLGRSDVLCIAGILGCASNGLLVGTTDGQISLWH
jgi:WD40 repeat protein